MSRRASPSPIKKGHHMKTEDTEKGRLEHWSPQDLAQAFARNEVAIIDVRTPQEYAFEHIHGALLAPLATFEPHADFRITGQRLR
jgi:predicted sulfurtransferase